MAKHDPGVRPQHRDVVGDGLGIGRTDADVDHGDAAAVSAHQVVGRHLRQARRRLALSVGRLRRAADAPRHHIARLDKGDVLAGRVSHGLMPQANKLVDVELVIGEQQKVLEMLGRRAGVMPQAMQRIVHPRRREQGQRQRLARAWFVSAVGDAVIHGAQIGQVKHVAHQLAALGAEAAFQMLLLGKRKMHRNRLGAGADFQRHPMVAHQQGELLQVVLRIQVGSGQGGLETAWPGHKAITQLGRSRKALARHCVGLHPHKGVASAHMAGQGLTGHKAPHGVAQMGQAGIVNFTNPSQRGGGVGEAGGGNETGQMGRHGAIVHAPAAPAAPGQARRQRRSRSAVPGQRAKTEKLPYCEPFSSRGHRC